MEFDVALVLWEIRDVIVPVTTAKAEQLKKIATTNEKSD
jgi:hypothetical protein